MQGTPASQSFLCPTAMVKSQVRGTSDPHSALPFPLLIPGAEPQWATLTPSAGHTDVIAVALVGKESPETKHKLGQGLALSLISAA